ncbi:MAG: aryldialkylphosphatase [Chloroflexota bacterium]
MALSVHTVLGPIDPAQLGTTSIHEHLVSVLDHVAYTPVDTPEGRELGERPVSLETRWFVRQQWVAVRDNLRLDAEPTATAEVAAFRAAGGTAIADPTTDGFGRDPAALTRISRATGVHLVMGAGYYVHRSHPDWLETAAEEAIAARIERDLLEGVGPDGVHAGFIGEVGCSWPMTDQERRSLRAAGRAQRATGAPLMVHPGRHPDAPAEIVRELESVGADLSRTTIAHIERTLLHPSDAVELARTGIRPSIDCFGLETAWYPLAPVVRMPNDGGRLAFVEALLDAGLGDRVLIAQDICQKHRLRAFGGHGYDHLLRDIPAMLAASGRADAAQRLLVENPAAWLAW